MNEEQFILLLDYLDKIGHKLGVGVGEVWPWFVKQQYIQACHNFILLITCLIISYFAAKFASNHWNPDNDRIYSITGSRHKDLCIIVLCTLCAFNVLSFAVFLSSFMDIFNPEYAAFKDIVAMVTLEAVKSD